MGCAAILSFFAGLVGLTIAIANPACPEVCLGPERWVFGVLGAAAIIGGLVIFARSRR